MSLKTVESQPVPMPEHNVFVDTSPVAVLMNLARLLHAYNPYITVVPASLKLWHSTDWSPSPTPRDGGGLPDHTTADPEFWEARITGPDRLLTTAAQKLTDMNVGSVSDSGVAYYDEMLAYTAAQLPFVVRFAKQQKRLRSAPKTPDLLRALGGSKAQELPEWGTLSVVHKWGFGNGPTDVASTGAVRALPGLGHALTYLSLWLRYDAIVGSDFFTGPIEAPIGVQKETYATAERASRLGHMMWWLTHQPRLFQLRELCRWLQSPAVAPLLEHVTPTIRDEFHERAGSVLNAAIHPWLAEAERLLLPARRYTRFGTSNYTQGLCRDGLFSRVAEYPMLHADRQATQVDVKALVMRELEFTVARLRELSWSVAAMKQEHLAKVATLFGAASPGSPAPMQLFGEAFNPILSSGTMTQRAVTDFMELQTTETFALGSALRMDAFSQTLAIKVYRGYTDKEREQLKETVAPGGRYDDLKAITRPAPVFVEPDMPEHLTNYTLHVLDGHMLRPFTDEEYFGDDDALLIPYDIESVANALGFSNVNDLPSSQVEHLFTRDNGKGWVSRYKDVTKVFHSARTRKPWLERLNLYGDARPRVMVAVATRGGSAATGVEAMVNLTPDRTFASADLASAVANATRLAAMK